MIEAGLVIGYDYTVLRQHIPSGRTSGSIPDDGALWYFLWENRDRVFGFAHSHPGSGIPVASHTDLTTFAAIEQALARRLAWWIASNSHVSLIQQLDGHGYTCVAVHEFGSCPSVSSTFTLYPWLRELQELSQRGAISPLE